MIKLYQHSIVLALLFTANILHSQSSTNKILNWSFHNLGLIIVALIVLPITIYLVKLFNDLIKIKATEIYRLQGIELEEEIAPIHQKTWWKKIYEASTKYIDINKENTIDLGHSYDDIRELDNSLPPWWLYMFYICIAFSGIYMWWYHWSDKGMDQIAAYKMEVKEGTLQKIMYQDQLSNAVTETSVTVLLEPKDIEAGKNIFKTYCAACHQENGGGGVGPNLTDEYWLHGGGINNVFKTIKYGVPSKGMIAWQAQLNPSDIQKTASYILSLKGTNPPGAKEAQGIVYVDSTSIKK
jgi:cytochrome c oxidase cbb3-type subunit III